MASQRKDEAAEALAMAAGARRSAADRLVTPWWYHPALGILLGGYLVAFSSWNALVIGIAVPLFFAGLGALVYAYRRLTGVWISGFAAGRASRWAYAVSVVVFVCMIAGLAISRATSLMWPSWCLAAVACMTIILIGRKFDTELRAQLRANR